MQTLTLEERPVPVQTRELWERHPHAVALRAGDRQMDYNELHRGADRFAAYLAQLGVVPGDTVAICMERCFDWIIAALGVMRAGAAYVPLDSAWPDARLQFAVNDCGAAVLVARATLLARLAVTARGVDPCRDAEAIAGAAAMAPRPIAPESLAYVIYTSGSTGVPKGVEITHANLAHLVQWQRTACNITAQDRVSHVLGLGFDAAVLELWPHLCAGATLCLVDEAARSSPEQMQAWMVREQITIGIVPAVLGARLIAMAWPAATALRLLITGGDVLHYGPAAALPFAVMNQYGPTECTVVSTWTVLAPGAEGTPPIGLPIEGAHISLRNEEGEPVRDGEVGEIYIGGRGVGRGYRNLPEATGHRFVPDASAGTPGARLYRTGDLGRRRPDGNLVFCGRLDRQTKIRGHRVELNEVDSVLNQHPKIAFATAISSVSEAGENQLLGYVLPKPEADDLTAHELQTYLLGSLPDYMIPAGFVRLQEIPLSANGKIDLTMLPEATGANVLKSMAGEAPATPIEETLLAMVRELLGSEEISTGDNFFLIGGHSLLGMQLLVRVRQLYDVDLTLRELFAAPTVRRMAGIVEEKMIAAIALLSDADAESQLTE